MRRALAHGSGPLAEGLAYLKAGDSFAAVGVFEVLRAQNPGLTGLDEALAAAYRRDARYDDSIAVAEEILARDPANVEARFERAVSLTRLGEAKAALAAFDSLVALAPDHAAAWFDSHGPALDLNGLDDALDRLEIAATRERANGRYWAFPYVYHRLVGQDDEAAAFHRRRLARYPNRRVLVDGVEALMPYRAKDCGLFGVSAHLLRFALARAGAEGLVLEFGVRRGASLAHLAAACTPGAVHGFDSFEGLPESWRGGPAGRLTTGARLPRVGSNAVLHPGWFADTLPAFLAANPGPVRFANIDSDLYSSARTVLTHLAPRLAAGAVLVFDEMIGNVSWRDDEYKAFCEFLAETGRAFEVIAIAPVTKQVAVRLG